MTDTILQDITFQELVKGCNRNTPCTTFLKKQILKEFEKYGITKYHGEIPSKYKEKNFIALERMGFYVTPLGVVEVSFIYMFSEWSIGLSYFENHDAVVVFSMNELLSKLGVSK